MVYEFHHHLICLSWYFNKLMQRKRISYFIQKTYIWQQVFIYLHVNFKLLNNIIFSYVTYLDIPYT